MPLLDQYEIDDANANTGYGFGGSSGDDDLNANTGFGARTEKSPWLDFSSNLFGRSGGMLEGVGKFTQNMAFANRFTNMAGALDLKSGAYGMAANWANIGLAFPELQQQIINIQTNIQRKQSLEKWQGRISSTQARYAKSGFAIDAAGTDTPLKAMLTLLEASDEELRWIDTEKGIREFNEVTMPTIQVKLQQSGAQYNKELTNIQQNQALRMSKIAKTNAYLTGIASVIGAGAKAYGGGK